MMTDRWMEGTMRTTTISISKDQRWYLTINGNYIRSFEQMEDAASFVDNRDVTMKDRPELQGNVIVVVVITYTLPRA